jgi:hypothetical protein
MKKFFLHQFTVLSALILCVLLSNNTFAQDNGTTGTQVFAVDAIPVLSFAVVYSLDNTDIKEVTVSDMDGCVMINESYNSNVGIAVIDYSSLRPDLYVITISSNNVSQAQILPVNFPICPPYCP